MRITNLALCCTILLTFGCMNEADPPSDGPDQDGVALDDDSVVCSVPTEGTIDDVVNDAYELEVNVSRHDGSGAPAQSDTFLLRVTDSGGYLFFNGGPANQVPVDRLDIIMDLVYGSSFHYNDSCLSLAIDGSPYPPQITLRNQVADYKLSVSEESCAKSDHSHTGNVISCADYQTIMAELAASAGQDPSYSCEIYW